MATTLVREPLSFEEDQHELDQLYTFDELATVAAETLGYRTLLDQLPQLKKDTKRRTSLKKAMVELSIQPFNAESVERYQSKKARHATPLTTRVVEGMLMIVALLCCGAAAIFFISLIACIICGISESLTVPNWLWVTMWTSLGTATATCAGIGTADGSEKKFIYAKWTSVPISEYAHPIPEFALQTAVDLKAKCPMAKFFIDELQFEERTLDPFLVVCDSNDRKYYLEVWNEPGFIQKRA